MYLFPLDVFVKVKTFSDGIKPYDYTKNCKNQYNSVLLSRKKWQDTENVPEYLIQNGYKRYLLLPENDIYQNHANKL